MSFHRLRESHHKKVKAVVNMSGKSGKNVHSSTVVLNTNSEQIHSLDFHIFQKGNKYRR